MATRVRHHPHEISKVVIGDHNVTIEELVAVARYGAKLSFSPSYCKRVNESRSHVEKCLDENRLVYGITTGFGSNVTKSISREDAETLQHNLIRSHAVSVGEPLETEVVRAMQFMILVAIGHGYSGVRLEVLEAVAAL